MTPINRSWIPGVGLKPISANQKSQQQHVPNRLLSTNDQAEVIGHTSARCMFDLYRRILDSGVDQKPIATDRCTIFLIILVLLMLLLLFI